MINNIPNYIESSLSSNLAEWGWGVNSQVDFPQPGLWEWVYPPHLTPVQQWVWVGRERVQWDHGNSPAPATPLQASTPLYLEAGRKSAFSSELCSSSKTGKQIWPRKQQWAFPSNSSTHPLTFHGPANLSHHYPSHPTWLKLEIDLHSNPDVDPSSQLDVTVQEIPRNDEFWQLF